MPEVVFLKMYINLGQMFLVLLVLNCTIAFLVLRNDLSKFESFLYFKKTIIIIFKVQKNFNKQ